MTDVAKHDENTRPTMIAVSNADGDTVVKAQANPVSHYLIAQDATGGSDNGNNNDVAMIDENGVAVMTALASDGSGKIIELYINPLTKQLLINSN